MDRELDRFSPQSYRDGTEPEWVVGYEMTPEGWQPIDAVRDEALLREAEESIERDGGISHEDAMAGLRAMAQAFRVAPVK